MLADCRDDEFGFISDRADRSSCLFVSFCDPADDCFRGYVVVGCFVKVEDYSEYFYVLIAEREI